MFARHQNCNMIDAAFNILLLIYHQTVYNLRQSERTPIVGLIMVMIRSLMLVGFFLLFYLILGIRTSPIRGDFILYILSGIFMYMTHVSAVRAVAGCGSINSAMTKHGPINSLVLIVAAALSSLYQQLLAVLLMLWLYHATINPISIYQPVNVLWMFLLAWFWGCCVGLIFLSISPWSPKANSIGTQVYTRLNMIASGKMFVANAMPAFLLPFFAWNPLFHIIDQTRGFMFINYNPHNTNIAYPIRCCIAILMIGLMMEFVTRQKASISWGAAR